MLYYGSVIRNKTTMNSLHAVTAEKVEKVVDRIIEIAQPKKVILFGSYIKGTMRGLSDLDILVVGRDDM